jgi:hypothetical protein
MWRLRLKGGRLGVEAEVGILGMKDSGLRGVVVSDDELRGMKSFLREAVRGGMNGMRIFHLGD